MLNMVKQVPGEYNIDSPHFSEKDSAYDLLPVWIFVSEVL